MKFIDFARYVKRVFLYSTSIVMVITFFNAFFNGGETLVMINELGEMYIEAALLVIMMVFTVISLILDYNNKY